MLMDARHLEAYAKRRRAHVLNDSGLMHESLWWARETRHRDLDQDVLQLIVFFGHLCLLHLLNKVQNWVVPVVRLDPDRIRYLPHQKWLCNEVAACTGGRGRAGKRRRSLAPWKQCPGPTRIRYLPWRNGLSWDLPWSRFSSVWAVCGKRAVPWYQSPQAFAQTRILLLHTQFPPLGAKMFPGCSSSSRLDQGTGCCRNRCLDQGTSVGIVVVCGYLEGRV